MDRMMPQERVASYGPGIGAGQGDARQRRAGTSRRVLLGALCAVAAGLRGVGRVSAAEPLRLVAFGDSLTAGFGLPAGAAFPAVLRAALAADGHAVAFANAGVSGDTAADGLARLDWSVPPGTRGVILELGANDALRGLDPKRTEAALDEIIAKLKSRGASILLCGMYAPRNLGEAYVTAFDAIYPRLAAKYGLILYPFFLDGVVGAQSLTLPDGLHPNAEGVRVIVSRILPTVERFIATLG